MRKSHSENKLRAKNNRIKRQLFFEATRDGHEEPPGQLRPCEI